MKIKIAILNEALLRETTLVIVKVSVEKFYRIFAFKYFFYNRIQTKII